MSITFEHVTKQYKYLKNTIVVLDDLTFKIEKGDFLVIKGPSGSGKTTMLRIIAGLAPVSSGTVSLFSNKLNDRSQEELALLRSAYIGVVFQDFQLIQTLTCLENVMLPMELSGEQSKVAFKEAQEQLSKVGLSHRYDHYPLQLSGGEQQRVAWARAFINSPDVLIADEPTANLDQITQKFIFDRLEEISKNPEITVIISTHEQEIQKLASCELKFDGIQKKFIFKRITDPKVSENKLPSD